MTQAVQDVNPAADPSPSQPAPTGAAPTEPDGGQQQHMVPSGRLKEEADRRRDAEKRAVQAEEQNRRLTAYLGTIYQQQQAQAKPAAAEPASPVDEFLNSTFGNDEAGRKARRAVELLAEQKVKEGGFVSLADVQRIVGQAVAGVQGRLQSTMGIANRLQEMHQAGLIDAEEMAEMQQEVSERVAQPGMESVLNNPTQMGYVVDSVIASRFTGRKLKSVQPARPANPLQPGNGHAPADTPPKFNPADSPFALLRDMKPEESERLFNESTRRNQGAR